MRMNATGQKRLKEIGYYDHTSYIILNLYFVLTLWKNIIFAKTVHDEKLIHFMFSFYLLKNIMCVYFL